ncbi:hypothetical protein [Bifidobacterium pseudocatenulatum]|uniref:hypothetical protein n=1 Tax=Bifidobacterium pseudocatenulatum TaxID=28026 RepID=UPI0034A58A45
MSFSKKIIAGVAAVATLAALAPAVAMADTAQNQNSATSSQAKEEYATVTFYTADGHSIQGVTWQKGTAFSQYALGIQAPTIEGKTFTGWAYSEGTMLKDTDQVFADIAVYATYADTPAQDDNTQYTVSFYAGADQLIQTVSYYAKDKAKFSQYALGIQAPTSSSRPSATTPRTTSSSPPTPQASRHRPSRARSSPAGASPPTTATSQSTRTQK